MAISLSCCLFKDLRKYIIVLNIGLKQQLSMKKITECRFLGVFQLKLPQWQLIRYYGAIETQKPMRHYIAINEATWTVYLKR